MDDKTIKVAELFAGVGGFRLALDGYHDPDHPELDMPAAGNFQTVWANQWEPPGTDAKQFAWRCYESRFGAGSCVNEDIAVALDQYEAGELDIPDVDMVVGGFPCQDYSVARPLSQSGGIEGEKGVLWWSIYRFLQLKSPKYCLFENVDRLLKSPARQRGRDFAIILSCLANLGYSAEWRVVNSAEYGFPQRRKRVFIYAERNAEEWDLDARLADGVMARALPIKAPEKIAQVLVPDDAYVATQEFNLGGKASPFEAAGAMQDFVCATARVVEDYHGPRRTLGDVLVPEDEVPEAYFVPGEQLPRWEYLKGAKREPRVDKRTGHAYFYSEGAMTFPDLPENPSRTILTGEGGSGASRFKHIVRCESGRYRRLVPDELDQLQTFPKGWTDTGMTDGRRAFCMGNALVVGVPHFIAREISLDTCKSLALLSGDSPGNHDAEAYMYEGLAKQQQVALEYLGDFAEQRLDYYRNPRTDGLTLKGLLSKDVVMFAARGVYTADEYVEEAFRAKESSSEETVMGNTWQAIIAAISADTLDSGDLMTVRDGALWVCELKAQPNTTNSSSFPQELRELKTKLEIQSRYQRASRQPLRAAFCVMRSTRSRDEERVYQAADGDRANYDLNGFKYRYLEGKKFWRWLADLDGPEGLVEDASALCLNRDKIRHARHKRMATLKEELKKALDEYNLPHNIDGVLKLKKLLN